MACVRDSQTTAAVDQFPPTQYRGTHYARVIGLSKGRQILVETK
jgi:hypothetical protein